MPGCPFCAKIADDDVDHGIDGWYWHLRVCRFEPLNPVVPGHMLLVPTEHLEHRYAAPLDYGVLAQAAATYVQDMGIESYNLIMSCGSPATQTIDHIHLHVVPRTVGDGLALPWTKEKA